MMPGPDRILRVSPSGSLVKVGTLLSGNTFGAEYWTDGKQEAPGWPDRPLLQCHPHTREIFWTDECGEIDTEEDDFEQAEYVDVPHADYPSVQDYHRALETGVASTKEKERYIRMRLWWAANDPARFMGPHAAHDRDNLQALISLLDPSNPNQRLMAAEACRELGDFDEALVLLEFKYPAEYELAVNRIKELTLEKDVKVRQL